MPEPAWAPCPSPTFSKRQQDGVLQTLKCDLQVIDADALRRLVPGAVR